MNLNRRSIILILPALSAGYLLAFLGMYHSQKNLLLDTEQNDLQVQAGQLTNMISHYGSLTRNYLHTFVQNQSFNQLLKVDRADYRALAVDGSLSDAVRHMGIVQQDHLTVAVLNRSGDLHYFYEDSMDPFSELDERYRQQVADMFRENTLRKSVFYEGDSPILTHARIIDRRTLSGPVNIDNTDSVAVIIALKAHRYAVRRDALVGAGRLVTWQHPEQVSDSHPLRLIAQENLPGFGKLSVIAPGSRLETQLAELRSILATAMLTLCVLSSLLLSLLIWRYITRPIKQLERDLATMDYESEHPPQVYDSSDEIGKLGRTFSGMYEDLRKSYQFTREMAERDGLTRLYNRRMFHHHLDRMLQRASNSDERVALLYIDLDNFKFINDTYGHGAGDELLKSFAERLREVLRPTDQVHESTSEDCTARLAGDEFAVLLYGYSDRDLPRRVAARILDICQQGALIEKVRTPTSLSIGVACYPDDADDAGTLVCNADSAMYQAKNSGKNRFAFYSEELASRSRRITEIETALTQVDVREFSLSYMPIVDAQSRQVCGIEALLRWDSAELGPVSPAEFIPIAESIGVCPDIDRWVLLKASADLPVLQGHLGRSLKMSVNISAAELESREFFNEVRSLAAKGLIEPQHLELEITETFHVNHHANCEAILHDLQALGFTVSIDDFGTGFTSLIQLVEYPISKIKLDRSFLQSVIERDRLAIVSSLAEFCKAQQFEVTAEGVETEEQADLLRAAGCDYLQGYYFFRPCPLDELISSLESRTCSANTPVPAADEQLRFAAAAQVSAPLFEAHN